MQTHPVCDVGRSRMLGLGLAAAPQAPPPLPTPTVCHDLLTRRARSASGTATQSTRGKDSPRCHKPSLLGAVALLPTRTRTTAPGSRTEGRSSSRQPGYPRVLAAAVNVSCGGGAGLGGLGLRLGLGLIGLPALVAVVGVGVAATRAIGSGRRALILG
eukprot:COSAG01_NODE_150_length_23941_cov_44.277200_14_plen_158_part_00